MLNKPDLYHQSPRFSPATSYPWNAYVHTQHPNFSSWKTNASPHLNNNDALLSQRLMEEEALRKKWLDLNYWWKMRLNETGVLSTLSCCECSSHFCSDGALPAAPGQQPALPVPMHWGRGDRSRAGGVTPGMWGSEHPCATGPGPVREESSRQGVE